MSQFMKHVIKSKISQFQYLPLKVNIVLILKIIFFLFVFLFKLKLVGIIFVEYSIPTFKLARMS